MFVIPYASLQQTSRAHARGVSPSGAEQLVADTFDSLWGRRAQSAASRTPPLDVTETDIAYHLAFEVPGVRKDQLKVSVEGRRVSLETTAAPAAVEVSAQDDPAQPQVPAPRQLYAERRAPHYARTVSLPAEVDQAASQARFEDGVLTLVLAKRVPTGATQLNIS